MFTVENSMHAYQANSGIATFAITASADQAFLAPQYGGSMLRGALGHALLKRFCRCQDQVHTSDCFYVHLFEGYRRNSQDGLPALLFSTPAGGGKLKAGDSWCFELHTIGLSPTLQQGILGCLREALRQGIGKLHCPFTLREAKPVAKSITLSPAGVEIILETPWLIKRHGRAIDASHFRLHDLLVGLAHRQNVVEQHFSLGLDIPSKNSLLAIADATECLSELRDVEWKRHSQRQGGPHPLSGVEGKLWIRSLNEETIACLGPLLANGAVLHGGGKTALGLGKLAVSASVQQASRPQQASLGTRNVPQPLNRPGLEAHP